LGVVKIKFINYLELRFKIQTFAPR
jgi:hypothetical protein